MNRKALITIIVKLTLNLTLNTSLIQAKTALGSENRAYLNSP